MFDVLRRFMADVAHAPVGEREFADDDYRLALAALLVHVANVDGVIDAAERTRLRGIIEERFGLDEAATTRLIARAEATDREAVDFFHFTHVLKDRFDDAGRHKIIELLWDIVFADGAVTEFEENVVWRIAELLGVSNRDRIMLRRKVAHEARPEPDFEGPWSPRGTRPAEG